MTRFPLLLTALLLLSGCSTAPRLMYEGPEKPAAETARLTGRSVILDKVDGMYGPNFGFGLLAHNDWRNSGKFDLRLLPGRHSLVVHMRKSIPPLQITFDAEAGKTYSIREDHHKASLYEGRSRVGAIEEAVEMYAEPGHGDAAVLVQSSTSREVGVYLYRIDGKCAADNAVTYIFNSWWNGAFSVKLAPGEHELEYSIGGARFVPRGALTQRISVEPGKKYEFEITKTPTPEQGEYTAKVRLLEVR